MMGASVRGAARAPASTKSDNEREIKRVMATALKQYESRNHTKSNEKKGTGNMLNIMSY